MTVDPSQIWSLPTASTLHSSLQGNQSQSLASSISRPPLPTSLTQAATASPRTPIVKWSEDDEEELIKTFNMYADFKGADKWEHIATELNKDGVGAAACKRRYTKLCQRDAKQRLGPRTGRGSEVDLEGQEDLQRSEQAAGAGEYGPGRPVEKSPERERSSTTGNEVVLPETDAEDDSFEATRSLDKDSVPKSPPAVTPITQKKKGTISSSFASQKPVSVRKSLTESDSLKRPRSSPEYTSPKPQLSKDATPTSIRSRNFDKKRTTPVASGSGLRRTASTKQKGKARLDDVERVAARGSSKKRARTQSITHFLSPNAPSSSTAPSLSSSSNHQEQVPAQAQSQAQAQAQPEPESEPEPEPESQSKQPDRASSTASSASDTSEIIIMSSSLERSISDTGSESQASVASTSSARSNATFNQRLVRRARVLTETGTPPEGRSGELGDVKPDLQAVATGNKEVDRLLYAEHELTIERYNIACELGRSIPNTVEYSDIVRRHIVVLEKVTAAKLERMDMERIVRTGGGAIDRAANA